MMSGNCQIACLPVCVWWIFFLLFWSTWLFVVRSSIKMWCERNEKWKFNWINQNTCDYSDITKNLNKLINCCKKVNAAAAAAAQKNLEGKNIVRRNTSTKQSLTLLNVLIVSAVILLKLYTLRKMKYVIHIA